MNISANEISRFITFNVSEGVARRDARRPAGRSRSCSPARTASANDQARGFQPTPQDFQFGVCAPGGSAPICSFPANQVPKAVDVLTPPGVSQATELNPTLGPVVLQGVTIP